MIKVAWPAANSNKHAQIWRVLDLSGMTNSVRLSRNYTRAGFVYLDGMRVFSIRETVELGRLFTLELRFPNGVTKSEDIMLVAQDRTTTLTSRVQSPNPMEKRYKG